MNFKDYISSSKTTHENEDVNEQVNDNNINESKFANILVKDMVISTYNWNIDYLKTIRQIKLYFNNMSEGELTASKISTARGDTELKITLLFVTDKLDDEDYLDMVGSFGEDCKKLFGSKVSALSSGKKIVDDTWSQRVITCTFV